MGQITTTTARYVPPDAALATTLARLGNAVTTDPDGCSISHQRAPTPAERSTLTTRRDALRGLLRRGDSRDVARLVTELLHGFPHAKVDAAEAQRTVINYGTELADLPVWAIAEAVTAFKRGMVARDNHTFAPSVAELRKEAEKRVSPVYVEGQQIAKILDARVIDEATEEERRRAVQRWDAIRAENFAPAIRQRDDEKDELRRTLQAMNEANLERELRAHGISDGIKIGVGLRRLLERDGARFPQPEDAA